MRAGWVGAWALRSRRHFQAARQQQASAKPCQLVAGTRDQFTAACSLEQWVTGFNAGARAQRLQLQVVQGGSHFWEDAGPRRQLATAVTGFLERLSPA